MPRIATCNVCHIIQRMPDIIEGTPLVPCVLEWVDGMRAILNDDDGLPKMVPAFDPMLEEFVEQHTHDLRDEFFTHGNAIQVMSVDQRTWDAMDVVTKIRSELQQQTGEHYAETDTYKEGALQCYNRHGNPDISTGCPDYLDDSKLIGKSSYDDGEGHTITIPPKFRQYLCYLCPYQQTYIQVELRRRRGMYKDGPTPQQVALGKRREKLRGRRR